MSLLLSNQKLKNTEGVKNNSRARAEQQLQQQQKVILSMEIGLATEQSISHQQGLLLCLRLQLESEFT